MNKEWKGSTTGSQLDGVRTSMSLFCHVIFINGEKNVVRLINDPPGKQTQQIPESVFAPFFSCPACNFAVVLHCHRQCCFWQREAAVFSPVNSGVQPSPQPESVNLHSAVFFQGNTVNSWITLKQHAVLSPALITLLIRFKAHYVTNLSQHTVFNGFSFSYFSLTF